MAADSWTERLPSGHHRARFRDPSIGRKRTLGTYRTQVLADQALRNLDVDLATGRYVDPTARRTTLRQFTDRWLPNAGLRPKAVMSYETSLRLHVLPTFGDRRLDDILTSDIQAWISRLETDGSQAPRSIRYHHAVLSSALSAAVKDQLVFRNAARGVRLPRLGPATKLDVPTPAQIDALEEHLGDRYKGIPTIAAYAGLRRGEILALQVGDVDLARRQLHIRRTVGETNSGQHIGLPKTARSVRTIPLHPRAEAVLRARCGGAERSLAQHPTSYVFPAADGGPLWAGGLAEVLGQGHGPGWRSPPAARPPAHLRHVACREGHPAPDRHGTDGPHPAVNRDGLPAPVRRREARRNRRALVS